jgi:hypothetical protein
MAIAVHSAPWVVVGVTLVVTLVLGNFAGQFAPAEDQNESFAPEAPALVAAETISDLFGSDASQSVMQVIISDDSGNAISLDALGAVAAIRDTVLAGAFTDYLVSNGQDPVVHYLAPVEIAVAEGAPAPSDDATVQQLYLRAISELPPDQVGLATGLLPGSGDAASATTPSGLLLIFTTGAPSTDEFDEFAAAASDAAAEIRATELPEGVTADPFSFELLFADQDEFQSEIGRLFATAGFIILLVLTIIFLVTPRSSRHRLMAALGLATLVGAVLFLMAPGMATLFPSVFPDSWADLALGPVLLIGVAIYALVYLTWTFSSRGLRRTTADTLLTILAIFMAISWMNGYGYLRFGDAGQLSQILPILLIGLGVDYSIHWNTRYREEIADGATVDASTTLAVRTVGVALVLATITTAVGFLTNVTNSIPELREFGELAAVGIVASFLLMLTFLPAVRELLDRRSDRKGRLAREEIRGGQSRRLPRLIGRAAWLPKHAALAVVIVSLVLGVAGAFGTSRLQAKFSFLDFVPTTSPLRGTFKTLLDDFGGGFGERTQVLIEGNVATAEAWNGMVQATGSLADTPNVILFGDQPAAQSPVSVLFSLIDEGAPTFSQEVAAAASAAGIDPQTLLAPPGADIGALYDAMAATSDTTGQVVTQDHQAALFTIQTNAGEDGAAALQEDLAADFGAVANGGPTAVPTSNEIISDVIITTLRSSQVSSLMLTLAAALVLLVANFWWESRRPLLGVITTLPVVLVVLWSFSIMVIFGIPFGPVTATISALAIGIGIPYMIHVTHRYQEDRVRYATEQQAVEQTLTHTGGALAGSALTTIAGFGILVTSTTIPFRQFGFVTAYTILLALLAGVLVLPSFLYLWDQYHRRRGDRDIEEPAPVLAES